MQELVAYMEDEKNMDNLIEMMFMPGFVEVHKNKINKFVAVSVMYFSPFFPSVHTYIYSLQCSEKLLSLMFCAIHETFR
jgi:hypothetical protein